jgi:hypothetical protein
VLSNSIEWLALLMAWAEKIFRINSVQELFES